MPFLLTLLYLVLQLCNLLGNCFILMHLFPSGLLLCLNRLTCKIQIIEICPVAMSGKYLPQNLSLFHFRLALRVQLQNRLNQSLQCIILWLLWDSVILLPLCYLDHQIGYLILFTFISFPWWIRWRWLTFQFPNVLKSKLFWHTCAFEEGLLLICECDRLGCG